MRRRIFTVLLMLVPGFVALAQTSIRVEAPNLVSADEQFNLTFSIDGEHSVSDFQWPGSDDFKTVWGPQKSSSSSVSIVNGKRSKTVTSSYTYVLMPLKAGSFSLPAATAKVQGKVISSQQARIEVVAGGGSSRQGSSSAQQPDRKQSGSASAAQGISDSDIYMRLLVSKGRAVVGESITATLKLYQRVNIAGFEDARFPSFDGFWSQEQQAPSNIEFRRENVGGEIFNTAVLRSWQLIPQKPGDVVIDPAELVCLVNVRAPSSSSGSIFDNFFQDSYRTVRKRISSQPVTFHISALPAGAPASFGGGVGKFDMSAALTRDSLKAHDAASLRVTVSGTGNISLLEAPKISFPPDFEVYDVKSVTSGGSRTFEYPFIPRSAGDFELGPVEYSYYDIAQGRYVTLSSGALPLSVARGADLGTGTAQSGGHLVQPSRRDVKDLDSDIRYISTAMPALRPASSFFIFSPMYFGIAAVLLLLSAGAWFVLRTLGKRREDVVGSRGRAATRMARKRLALAGGYMQQNLCSAFYEELHRALLGFVSDKLNMDAADMTKENIRDSFVAAGSGKALADELVELLDGCEYARYSPDQTYEAMNTHYEKAVSVISSIDAAMKGGPRKAAGATAVMLLLMLLPMGLRAGNAAADSLWVAGVEAYGEGRWADAVQAWKGIETDGFTAPALFCNIGDACYRQGDLAGAVLYYSRALKMDPSCKDARHNLEFVNGMLQDKIEEIPPFFLTAWMRGLCYAMPSDSWAVLSLLLLAGVLAMVLLFALGRSSSARKLGFFVGIVLCVLMVVAGTCAHVQKRDALRGDRAVVMRPVAAVKSSPGSADAKDLFILHEGTSVQLLEELGGWASIRLSDGRQGWIQAVSLEII